MHEPSLRGGFLVVVPEMPLSLAVLDADAADNAIERHPEYDQLGDGRAFTRRRDGVPVRR